MSIRPKKRRNLSPFTSSRGQKKVPGTAGYRLSRFRPFIQVRINHVRKRKAKGIASPAGKGLRRQKRAQNGKTLLKIPLFSKIMNSNESRMQKMVSAFQSPRQTPLCTRTTELGGVRNDGRGKRTGGPYTAPCVRIVPARGIDLLWNILHFANVH